MRIDGGRGLWGAILIALLSTASVVHAQGCEPRVARIISVQGPVVVERSGVPRAQAAGLDDTIRPGDRVRVGALGRAAVQLANEAETPIRLDEGTTLTFPAPEPEKSFLLRLIEGVVHVLTRVPQPLTIETPLVAAGVEGTEFVLRVSKSILYIRTNAERSRYAAALSSTSRLNTEGTPIQNWRLLVASSSPVAPILDEERT